MNGKLGGWLLGVVLLAGIQSASAQLPVISSFSQNGVLRCTNLPAGSTVTVAWASTLAGPWQTNWAGLTAISAGSNGMLQVSVPMFYRLLVVATNAPGTNATVPAGMASIPAGTFTMGDTQDGESDAISTNIYVSAFFMDTNLVSYSLWQAVYAYAISKEYDFDNAGSGKATNHPVQTVSWYDCVKWCNARSQQAGLTPVYYADAGLTQVYNSGDVVPYVNWSATGYRLPTEAEWEKAARGGLSGERFPWGNTITESQANYYAEPDSFAYDLSPYEGNNGEFETGASPYTSPVGSFAPNGYGLFDMAGNVGEWCWDWYGSPYGQPTTTNPTGPATGDYHLTRGGYWNHAANLLRCANRVFDLTSLAYDYNGFRCVRGH